ncbi:MAG: hypothetical protein WCT41_03020 [Candidatus Paceibacterota bacterium]
MKKFDRASSRLREVADRIKRPLAPMEALALGQRLKEIGDEFNEAFTASQDQDRARHVKALRERIGRLEKSSGDFKILAAEMTFHLESLEPTDTEPVVPATSKASTGPVKDFDVIVRYQ